MGKKSNLEKDFMDDDFDFWGFCGELAEETTKNMKPADQEKLLLALTTPEEREEMLKRASRTMEQEIEEKIKWAYENEDGVAWLSMGKLKDGRELCLVFGWSSGYEKGEDYQKKVGDELWTLCSKLAVNIDDLQCDYEIDWYMPYYEDGDVCDTEMAVSKSFDLDYYKKEAKELIKLLNKGEITV